MIRENPDGSKTPLTMPGHHGVPNKLLQSDRQPPKVIQSTVIRATLT